MDILNSNITNYVLNQYLDYFEDILKLKQLYKNINSNFKSRLEIKKYKDKLHNKITSIYVDKMLYKKKEFYLNRKKKSIERFYRGIYHGYQLYWYKNGQLEYENNFKYGKRSGYQYHYNMSGDLRNKEFWNKDGERRIITLEYIDI
jgi:antitoxin component YwqK of YwqJK toxin-antitoxin module